MTARVYRDPAPEVIARVLGCAPGQVGYHLVALPAWDSRPAPGHPSVRLTALVRSARGLRAVVFEAPTEAEALARLCGASTLTLDAPARPSDAGGW